MPESRRHILARTALFMLLEETFTDTLIGSDHFVYWDAANPKKALAPDVFVKIGTPKVDFNSWKIWERGAPDLAVEIVSDSDRSEKKWAAKLACYQSVGVNELVRFDQDRADQPLRVWDRVEGELLERSPDSSTLRECSTLGLWWVITQAEFGPMLRLARDPEGREILPTSSEARALAEQERARFEQERARSEQERARSEEKLREASVELEQLRAEMARLRGER